MKFGIYSIRDRLTGFMSPVLEQSDPVALRNFRMACDVQKRDSSVIAHDPVDFELYRFGDFDSISGHFDLLEIPDLICRGSDFSD